MLISILLVGIFSGGIALLLSPFIPSWWTTFGISFIAIFAGMFIRNSQKERKIEADQLEIYAKADLLDHRNTVLIECPCNNNSFSMQVYPNELNSYTCTVCNNKFNLDLRIEPVLQTEPMNLDSAYSIFKELGSHPDQKVFEELSNKEQLHNGSV